MKRLQPIAIFLFLFLVCTLTAHAQIGIGTTTPDPNAALDIESTTQGVLIPRMLKAQRELIGGGSPAAGLLVYQTDDAAGFYFYNGTAWVSLSTKTPSGLESIDEGNGNGLVRVGRDPANYGNVGLGAMDLSDSSFPSTTLGATGLYSVAMGALTTASGFNSTAMGQDTTASESFSTAMGISTTASGSASTAIGFGTIASGNISTAMGEGTISESQANLAIGEYNVGGGNPTSSIPTDPVFEIGNGTSNNFRSNALTVLKNGTITAPSFDISEITDIKALITKEYADANLLSSGLEAINEGNGVGLVKVGRTAANYGNVGLEAMDLSYSSFPSTTFGATGSYSVAIGVLTTASGFNSTAMGQETTASGSFSTAMGISATASGSSSTAMGLGPIASGDFSTAMGEGTIAESQANLAIGKYNVGGGNPTSSIPTDPVFEIGNGTSSNFRSNALTVLKNGNATLAGNLTENSDFRLKKNIQSLENSLVKLLKLEGKNYYWNDLKPHSKDLQIGLIAQELETVFPELVHTGSDGYKSVDYTSLIPVIIEATKSQQEIIETQNKRIKALEEQNRKLLALEARLKALENDKNTSNVADASK